LVTTPRAWRSSSSG